MIPGKIRTNLMKPLRASKAPVATNEDDPTVDENGEGTVMSKDDNEAQEPGNPAEQGEDTDEEIVDSLVQGLSPEQKSLLLSKLQEESSNTSEEK